LKIDFFLMEAKQICIIKGMPGENYKAFTGRMFDLADRIKGAGGIHSLKMVLTDSAPPRLSVIPFKKEKVAAISIRGNHEPVLSMMLNTGGFAGAYQVEEAVPVGYDPNWEPGSVTPGVCLLTLFHRNPGIQHETFIDRWHNSHTPLSLNIHPLWNYNRNMVKISLSEGSFWYDGIVEEQFRSRRDLLNPFIFFGPLHRVPLHMLQVYRDTKSFIDFRRIETYLANEYLLSR
jgi:hypothetical protein